MLQISVVARRILKVQRGGDEHLDTFTMFYREEGSRGLRNSPDEQVAMEGQLEIFQSENHTGCPSNLNKSKVARKMEASAQ